MNRKTGNVYTPGNSKKYEELIAWSALAVAGGVRFEAGTPLVIHVDFHCEREGNRKLADIDNLVKTILDGLQKSGIIANDRDIIAMHLFRHEVGSNPRAEVELNEIIVY